MPAKKYDKVWIIKAVLRDSPLQSKGFEYYLKTKPGFNKSWRLHKTFNKWVVTSQDATRHTYEMAKHLQQAWQKKFDVYEIYNAVIVHYAKERLLGK